MSQGRADKLIPCDLSCVVLPEAEVIQILGTKAYPAEFRARLMRSLQHVTTVIAKAAYNTRKRYPE